MIDTRLSFGSKVMKLSSQIYDVDIFDCIPYVTVFSDLDQWSQAFSSSTMTHPTVTFLHCVRFWITRRRLLRYVGSVPFILQHGISLYTVGRDSRNVAYCHRSQQRMIFAHSAVGIVHAFDTQTGSFDKVEFFNLQLNASLRGCYVHTIPADSECWLHLNKK